MSLFFIIKTDGGMDTVAICMINVSIYLSMQSQRKRNDYKNKRIYKAIKCNTK